MIFVCLFQNQKLCQSGRDGDLYMYKDIDFGEGKTVGELRILLDDVIKEFGEDATWWGWDAGNIYVSESKNKPNPRTGYIDSCIYDK